MGDSSLFGMLDQVSGSEGGEVFRSIIRVHVRDLVSRVMAEEVNLLCGPKHAPTGGEKYHFWCHPLIRVLESRSDGR